jgi:protein-S-isoprenylcysteine O-methyltransferase Ste14
MIGSMDVHSVADCMWGALGIYWLWSARQRRKVQVSEAHGFRVLRLAILTVTFVLLVGYELCLGLLDERFARRSVGLESVGLGLTALGIGLTVWARRVLGSNWSDKVEIQQDHELIHTGPYAFFRHPIYSGMLTGVAGTALAFGRWRGVVAFAVLLTSYAVKAKKEERMLEGRFGEKYREYERSTGFLLPRLRKG